jgi:hypothetical protein
MEPKKNALLEQLSKLKSPPKGRRFFSWALFLGVISIGLAIPLFFILTAHPPQPVYAAQAQTSSKLEQVTTNTDHWVKTGSAQSTPLALDRMWSPGKSLQSAHQPWSKDCKACHTEAFAKVKNEDCKACHKNAGDHIDKHQFKSSELKEVSCTSCHKEHQGEDGLTKQNKHFIGQSCADCHTNIKANFKEAKIENVDDFAKNHPDFKYQIAQSSKPKDLQEVRMSANAKLTEKTSLIFPHDVHLNAKGIKSPKGSVTMKCADCHAPKSDGSGFEPTTMKDHCQSCHDLRFEPAVSNREVPHGSVDQVLSTLREFYGYVQTARVPVDAKPTAVGIDILKPGTTHPAPTSFVTTAGDARAKAARSATSLFEETTCITCHVVTRSSKAGKAGTPGQDLPQWDIEKVTPQHAWLKGQTFNHNKHKTSSCKDCHQAEQSKKAEEVLMPSIKVCRDCHAGQKHESNKVTSDCGLCHGFHKKTDVENDALLKSSKVSH